MTAYGGLQTGLNLPVEVEAKRNTWQDKNVLWLIDGIPAAVTYINHFQIQGWHQDSFASILLH